MSRRHSAEKREVNPDPKFGNIIITKFMNSIMYDGKKSAAESIVYGALELIETKTKQGPLPVFEQALENVMPTIEVRSRRVEWQGERRQEARRRAPDGGSQPRLLALSLVTAKQRILRNNPCPAFMP